MNVRASSLPELFDCAARWEAKHVRGLHLPASGNAILGKAVHASTAKFDASVMQGSPITVDDACGVVVDAVHRPDEDVDWGEDNPQDAENIGIALTCIYCRTVAPTMNYVAVEAKCDRLDVTDLGLSLTGTTDRVTVTEDGYGVADIKTGKSAVSTDGTIKTQGHAAQIAVYELLAEQATGRAISAPAIIIGLQVAKTYKGRRAGAGKIYGARELLLGSEDFPGLLEHAAAILRSGLFYGNPRSMMCDKKYCPAYAGCRWRM